MSLIAQVPPESNPADSPNASERWDQLAEFWRNIDREHLGANLWRHVQTQAFWIDTGAVVLCLAAAAVLSRLLRKHRPCADWYPVQLIRKKLGTSGKFPIFLATFALLLWLGVLIAGLLGFTCPVLRAVTIIYTAYLAIRLPSLLAPGRFWVKPLATLIITATVLAMFGLLDETIELFDQWAFQIGGIRISVLSLILGPVIFLVAYSIGRLLIGFTDRRMARSANVPPTVRVLTGKVLQFFMVVIVIGITLTAMGINPTALTVFGGALGLGVGFGLQKVISNLFSGIIILLDRSIKPGDVIEIGDTWGVINGLQTRYVSVMTRDKKEILIPNEDFITQPVVNWSFSDKLVRYRVPIGVSYNCDVREAIRLAEEAAVAQERVRTDPAPSCRMRGFGDSAIDLELRFWVVDPGEGRGNIISAVLLSIWDAYKENGIELPFPQRDVHLRSGGEALREIVSPEKPDAD